MLGFSSASRPRPALQRPLMVGNRALVISWPKPTIEPELRLLGIRSPFSLPRLDDKPPLLDKLGMIQSFEKLLSRSYGGNPDVNSAGTGHQRFWPRTIQI